VQYRSPKLLCTSVSHTCTSSLGTFDAAAGAGAGGVDEDGNGDDGDDVDGDDGDVGDAIDCREPLRPSTSVPLRGA